jgi:hypothetical protein
MNEPSDQLDTLLRQWASQHEPSADRLEQLRARIVQTAAGAQPSMKPAAATWQTNAFRLAMGLVAAAAVILLVVAVGRNPKVTPPDQNAGEFSQAHLPEEHLRRMMSEMNSLFDQRLAWVAETNQEFSVGLDEQNLPPSTGPRVAVRIVVVQRESDSDRWQTVWSGDIATRSEQRVDVLSERDGSQLHLWTYVLPDGNVSIDTELALSKTTPAWMSSAVQQPDVPMKVLAVQRDDREFQIWQTAIVLPEASL